MTTAVRPPALPWHALPFADDLTPVEVRRSQKPARRGDRPPAPPRREAAECGTEPGVKAHRRRGEPVCRACQDAKNAANRRRAAAKRPADAVVKPRAAAKVTIRRIYEIECRTCDVIVACSRTRAGADEDRRDHLARFHGGQP